jgi:hypothetical protein
MAYRAKIDGIEVRFDWKSRRWVSRDVPSFAKNLNAIPLESLVALARFENPVFPTSGALYINALAKVFGGEVLEVDNPARREHGSAQ